MIDTKALTQVNIDANVTLDDMVNVFLSKYEEAAYQKRSDIQKQMKELNGQYVDIKKQAIRDIEARVLAQLNQGTKEGPITVDYCVAYESDLQSNMMVVVGVGGCVRVDGKTVGIGRRSVESLSQCPTSHEFSSIVQLMIPLDEVTASAIAELTERTKMLSEQLLEVNNDLRSLDRRARRVRGQLAEMKMKQAGMEGLLTDQQLLLLIEQQ